MNNISATSLPGNRPSAQSIPPAGGNTGQARPDAKRPRRAILTAFLLMIVAVPLILGGGYLATLGGSFWYVLAGLAVGASGLLLLIRRREALWLYWAMLAATLGWAVGESGLNAWALAPRLIGPVVIGIWLVSPIVRRSVREGSRRICFVLLACGGVTGLVLALTGTGPVAEADPLYQTGGPIALPVGDAMRPATLSGPSEWAHYGGDLGGSRFSELGQINAGNVKDLQVAWTYRTGPAPEGYNTFQANPLQVDDQIYICTGYNDVISLDAETGQERWRFRSGTDLSDVAGMTCRGVAFARVADAADCPERIITNTLDARLVALDAETGKPCRSFGNNGVVSLLPGMGSVIKGYYYATSAPTIARGRIILGGWVSDGQYWGEPSGVIRAFDVRTGVLSWAFDMARQDRTGLPGPGEHYTRATPNSWAPMSADEELGLVYVPTGNATPDYFGAQRRPFDDAYSSSVLALDLETGRLRWNFQTVHHDLWDYDVGSQPTLVDLPARAGGQKALVLPTKRGEVFMLDRATGHPLANVAEIAVPQAGKVKEDRLSPTQPFSVGMPSFRGPALTESKMWGLTPIDQLWCRIKFREARYEGPLTPPGLSPSITYPGYLGGMDWGGVAIDRDRGLLIANTNNVANYTRLLSAAERDVMKLRPRRRGSNEFVGGAVPQAFTPYAAITSAFLSPLGVPCQQPPYGRITAVDLASKRVVWTKPLGTARDSGPFGIGTGLPLAMGVPNLGGAIVTRGDLTWIGATQDRYLRAFQTSTGKLVWQDRLPAGGQATPTTYISPKSGRQMIVIPAGGLPLLQSKTGDYVVAYALPTTSGPKPSGLRH